MGRRKKEDPQISSRPELIKKNPKDVYDMDVEATLDTGGEGKFARVVKATHKETGKEYAAKCIKYDSETMKFALREYDIMMAPEFTHESMVNLHEAYIVQKYLILIMDLVEGKTVLNMALLKAEQGDLTEDHVACMVKQFCTVFADFHSKNYCHLDIRPTNVKFANDKITSLKLLDYNSARHIPNKKAGAVVDVIGDTEFCAPEMLLFEPVQPGSDMWSLGVIMYILLSGISPFFDEDESKVILSVQKVQWKFDDSMDNLTSEAKDFISKVLIRAPESRMTAADALAHKWLSDDYKGKRQASKLDMNATDLLGATEVRLCEEEAEEYIEGSFVFRTFEEDEYESPEDSEEEEG
jgi:serine/threonine protein kinase